MFLARGLIKHFTKTLAVCLMSALAVYAAVCAVHVAAFPAEIRLTESTRHRFAFGTPLRATIQSETVDVLWVNHQPLDAQTSVTVRLQDPLWLEADSSGTALMQLSAFGLPLRAVRLDVLPELEVIPVGMTVGIRINTQGVMVLGTGMVQGADGSLHNPSEGKLRAGDLILTANGQNLGDKEDLMAAIAQSSHTLALQVQRDNNTHQVVITPVESDDGNMIGSWVRDSTQGIGTITYINPATNTFGALGHGIMDVDTKKLMSVRSGYITLAAISSIKRGMRGTPGELVGELRASEVLGQIRQNSPSGIYGCMNTPLPEALLAGKKQPLRVAKQDQITEGPATLRTNVVGNEIRDYDIRIEGVNRFSADATKGLILRITDPELLKATGGIVQGMSGSPILQNGKIVGALTHVFVQDPTKGYGIFIENMILQESVAESCRFMI